MKKRVFIYELWVIVVFLIVFRVGDLLAQNPSAFDLYGYEGMRGISVEQLTASDLLCDSSYIYQSRDSTQNNWILNEKAVYKYDKQGREISRIIYDRRDKTWVEKQRIQNTYKSDFLNYQDEFVWDALQNQWLPNVMRTYNYNYLDLVDEEKIYQYKNAQWQAGSKINYFYNTDFLLDFESHYEWNEVIDDWFPAKRTLYVYNDDYEVSKEVVQTWIDSTSEWVNKTSQVYNFNDEKNLISFTSSVWDAELEEWISNSSVFIDYLTGNEPKKSPVSEFEPAEITHSPKERPVVKEGERSVNEIVRSYWDEEIGSWETHQKQTNYWSNHLKGNLQNSQKEMICKFANPYTVGLPWQCEFLNPKFTYTIRVYDLAGRCFYTNSFQGNSTFRIEKDIEPGFYIFEITGGLDKHSEKVYVKR